MSTVLDESEVSPVESTANSSLDDSLVADYLLENPDFLIRHPEVMVELELTHEIEGAVSMMQRQVGLLRGKNSHLSERLDHLMLIAQENESRVLRINRLARVLIRANSQEAILCGLSEALTARFDVDSVFIGITLNDVDVEPSSQCRAISEDDALRRVFSDFLRMRRTECGSMSEAMSVEVFGEASKARSYAIAPLDRHDEFGFMVLGSDDQERFREGMGTLFVDMTADLVAAALRRSLHC